MIAEMIVIGFILDLILGDPPSWPHPVKYMGKLIDILEKSFNLPSYSHRKKQFLGGVLWLLVVAITGLLGAGIMWVASFNYWLLLIIGSYFCYSCLSIKGLAHEGLKIARSLRENNLGQARKQVGMIVGRDTQQLDAEGVMDATVETIAENTSDGVIAPLIFMAIAGPVGGLMYKAVNTLDSMVGYKDDRFKDIGFVSAKLDDVFNWIPARFTWLLLVIASFLLRFHVREAITIGRRDREKHLSPNSGFSESVVAGALNIRLGGPHMYFGKLVEKPFIGSNNARTTEIADIQRTVWMLYVAASLGLLITVGCRMLIER